MMMSPPGQHPFVDLRRNDATNWSLPVDTYEELHNKMSPRGGSPGSKVSILGSVGSVGPLVTEIQASQAGNFSRNFETSCLASLDLSDQRAHTTHTTQYRHF